MKLILVITMLFALPTRLGDLANHAANKFVGFGAASFGVVAGIIAADRLFNTHSKKSVAYVNLQLDNNKH